MKVLLFDPAAPMSEAGRPAATSVQAARWRLALEQAQWQQAGDRSSLPRASGASPPPPSAPPGGAAARLPVLAGPGADVLPNRGLGPVTADDDAAPAASVDPAATTASLAETATTPSSVELGIQAPAASPPPTGSTSTTTAGSVPATEAHAMCSPALPEFVVPTPWPPFNAQAYVDGRAVSAAVRDPNLDPNDADDLERRLASHLAADGLELVELRVNGRLVGRANRPADQN